MTTMYTTTAARPSSSDLSFFSKSKSSKNVASNATPSVVTTRVAVVPKPPDGTLKLKARSATPPGYSSISDSVKRRRIEENDGGPEKTKKPRVSLPSGDARSRAPSSTPANSRQSSVSRASYPPTRDTSLERGSRSRSVSEFPLADPPPRDCSIEEGGRPGAGFLSCESVVQNLMKTYKGYFTNPNDPEDKRFEPHPTDYPVTELEYPNTGACERFVLLVPKDKDHYNPIMCLENTLHTILENYLTPAQQALFGSLPTTNLADDDSIEASPPPSESGNLASPASSLLSLTESSVSTSSSLPCISMLSSISELSPYASQGSASATPTVNYLRLLRRAVHKRDGPLFLSVMAAINTLLRLLKYPPVPEDPFELTQGNCIRRAVKGWTHIPKNVITRIIDETYQRAVGPHSAMLNRYEAFSSEVYGELMPSFVSQIVQATGLNSDSLFLDLGSGVGNVVLQASLQTGCRSFGIEVMPTPAKIARSQLEQFQKRCRMWGVRMGDVELEEGDMLTSARVDELVPKADVVLVNNKVFLESLNEALRPKFLDLKEGAIVVSLKPFVSSTRLTRTERNLDDISAIFRVSERKYYPGSVSWGSGGGSFYLHRVDREWYANFKQDFEHARTTSSRSTRMRR